jgi:sigma-B regulation protein RsbU (phosphoserine phosphatase)
LSIIRIDSENSLVTYAGAGDLPLLSYNDESGEITSVQSSGLLLGLMPDTAYDEQTLNLAPNGQLFIFTDGMIDFNDDTSKKSDYRLFSSRMQTFMQQKTDFSDLKKYFMQQIPQQVDDCSIINIKRTPHYD